MATREVHLGKRLRIVATLGVRFHDAALQRPVTGGLAAFAQTPDTGLRRVAAVRSPSGAYSFHGLPGLHALEYPLGDAAAGSPPQASEFLVLVDDRLGRFHPVVFGVSLPLDGLPPPEHLPLLQAYLFSAPTRPVTSDLGAVRADLWDETADAPAAYALMRVTVAGRETVSYADAEGRCLVAFPYPIVEQLRLGSPPGSAQAAPAAQSWPTRVTVEYTPGLTPPAVGPASLPQPWTRLPGLKSILQGQAPALIRTADDALAPELEAELVFGAELVLRSPAQSRLSLTPGASPP